MSKTMHCVNAKTGQIPENLCMHKKILTAFCEVCLSAKSVTLGYSLFKSAAFIQL